jgi:hypothetical protein
MKDKRSFQPAWVAALNQDSAETSETASEKKEHSGMSFDNTEAALSELKRLQDAGKFSKARFQFRLYKRL